MVGIAPPSPKAKWGSLSFASTLYLHPVLDTLLGHTPTDLRDELRLGLQEALVNAAKHGNQLDPRKTISVQYIRTGTAYWWVITDQGSGFPFPAQCHLAADANFEAEVEVPTNECGRGLFILYQIFDEVRWSSGGKEVHLCKQVRRWLPLSMRR
ncbi:MAG: ATP-binding protein [Leptolyngbya sp. SIO4C1]|nr:ATP-binding protein [Leptolyngbya sp. SIO4C1]